MTVRGRGAALVLVAACGYAFAAILAKTAYDAGVGVVTLLAFRFTMAFAILLGIAVWRGVRRPDLRTILTGLSLGALLYAPQSGLFFASLTRLDAGLAALVSYAYPALVGMIAALMGRERLTARRVVALAGSLGGVALVLVGSGTGSPDVLGVVFALGAAVGYAAYVLVADIVARGVHPLAVAVLVSAGCALAFTTAGLVAGDLSVTLPATGWLAIAGMAVASTVIPLAAFLAGMRVMGPSVSSILMTTEPLVTAVAATAVLGEALGLVQWAGGLMVLAAVVMLGRERAGAATTG